MLNLFLKTKSPRVLLRCAKISKFKYLFHCCRNEINNYFIFIPKNFNFFTNISQKRKLKDRIVARRTTGT